MTQCTIQYPIHIKFRSRILSRFTHCIWLFCPFRLSSRTVSFCLLFMTQIFFFFEESGSLVSHSESVWLLPHGLIWLRSFLATCQHRWCHIVSPSSFVGDKLCHLDEVVVAGALHCKGTFSSLYVICGGILWDQVKFLFSSNHLPRVLEIRG